MIRKIINSSKISTQEELLSRLSEKGYAFTQATLSRDLKFLKVSKIVDAEKGYIYFLPDTGKPNEPKSGTKDKFPMNGLISIRFANNLCVIKTKAGYASSITTMIDNKDSYEIIGTIAGDDTILIVPAEGVSQKEIKNILIMIMPELEGKI